MELYQLEYFKSVARNQSFTAAAAAMNVSQPTISIAIQKLEKELGVELLNKKDKPVTLTPVGQAIFDRAVRILIEGDNIREEVADYLDNAPKLIRFGVPLTLCNDLLSPIKTEFLNGHPEIQIMVAQYGVEILEPELAAGNLDLCILSDMISKPELEYVPFKKTSLYACFSANHPFSAYDHVTPEMLAGKELLVSNRKNGVSRLILNYLAAHIGEYALPHRSSFVPQSMLALAEEGMGIAIIEKNFAQKHYNVKCLPLDPPLEIQTVLAWNKNKYIGKAQKTFISYLKKHA
ncbi:MAG: LysR family transcriptional regulator [Clostridiales Family XIII bacterium]|nr:LysR family transcriptional regulator [Clostridiales Family XIII bacterium]